MERIPLRDNSTGRGLIVTTFGLLLLGVVMVHSAVASVVRPGPWYARLDVRHTIFAAVAAVVLLTAWRLDYRRLAHGKRWPILGAVLLGVAIICAIAVFVPGIGHSVAGRHRWIRIGPPGAAIGFQPSELVKFALVIFLAGWLSRQTTNVRSFRRTFLPAAGLTGLCVALVITQDFSTGFLLGAAAVATMFLAGVPWCYLASLFAPAAGGFFWLVVRNPNRWQRIQAVFDPWSKTNPCAYQPRQSLLAIITGGWTGKGVGGGEMKLGFLPEDSTDFIFSVFCEEWGFIGAMLLMGLLVLWIWHVRRAAVRASDGFGQLLAGALGFLVALQAVLHIAVDLVAAPPTGMGMPFVSAGGTSLVVMAAATAIIISVTSRRAHLSGHAISRGAGYAV
ncbi:MAG: FtsW/RodA/SpoVE family cell cycle protein [Planctomycetota bacterium]|nr:FtsW/RodA/SpoVE family cell cycle protein [Planctomycetota bacterium]